MKFLMFLSIINPKTKKLSYSRTMTLIGFLVINLKLLCSGISFTDKLKFDLFNGVDYAASLTAIAGLHIFNKKSQNPKEEN